MGFLSGERKRTAPTDDVIAIEIKSVEFSEHAILRYWGCADSIGILIKLKSKTEKVSFVNGGPHKSVRTKHQPVDYKDGELSNLEYSEFHHIIGQPLFLFPRFRPIGRKSL